MKIKVFYIVCLFIVFLYTPACSTDYVSIFKQTRHIQPEKASMEQLREFYNSYTKEIQKRDVLVQMAVQRKIPLYKDGMPSAKFMDFALTIENQLPASDTSILVPIYKDNLLWTSFFAKKYREQWKNDIENILGKKTVRVGKNNIRASFIARNALFEAVLQNCLENRYCDPIGLTDSSPKFLEIRLQTTYGKLSGMVDGYGEAERYCLPTAFWIDVYSVKNKDFGLNSAKRRQLIKQILRKATTSAVENGSDGGICYRRSNAFSSSYVWRSVPRSAPGNEWKQLFYLEKIVKDAGGDGFDPADPSWQELRKNQAKISLKAIKAFLTPGTSDIKTLK